ncbi:hypothetical protein CWB72_20105 [Pseudoalteromonas phenolica]|uniref:hypothetical protein n=1 Tax=Pseudoalteromonas phenolica TaxID=161398 RepID=UPI00110B0559|nr:hypothetical protein [Pseudoalteromonas phenolica]TMN86237.1 hypothetical protein CWB72_20105 [Pseudoalteromonas phenolica]
MRLKEIILIMALSFIVGCTVKPLEINQSTGFFPTDSKVKEEDILINLKIDDIKKYKYVYLTQSLDTVQNMDSWRSYRALHTKSLSDIKLAQVVSTQELGDIAASKGLKRNFVSFDNAGLEEIAKHVGPFLRVHINYEPINSEWNRYTLEVYDPLEKQYVYKVSSVPLVLFSEEEEMIYPAFNSLISWVKSQRN